MEENKNIDKKSLKFLNGKNIGMEINKHKVRRILKQMVDIGQLKSEGVKKWTRYSIEQNLQENQ